MSDRILTLNAGSSSLKYALFEVAPDGRPARIAKGKLDSAGANPDPVELIAWAESENGGGALIAVGHRVVHGGREFSGPAPISDALLERLDRLTPLAPLHQPHNLAPIRAIRAARPALPQVACFDTAFHRGRAPVTTRFALPRAYEESGIERYGFHGLSYEYIAGALRAAAPGLAAGRVIVAHLGNGASLCALLDGRSVDTTMSFTALDGVPMGTRSGSIDPGVLLYLMRERGMGAAELEDLLYHRSGLLGVSGLSGDMRVLLESGTQEAADAIELFAYRVAYEIGGLAASLGGLDGLVFTAGIGENAAEIRRRICERSAWLGVALDGAANAAAGPCISTGESRVAVWVIPTDEEEMIARHTLALLQASR